MCCVCGVYGLSIGCVTAWYICCVCCGKWVFVGCVRWAWDMWCTWVKCGVCEVGMVSGVCDVGMVYMLCVLREVGMCVLCVGCEVGMICVVCVRWTWHVCGVFAVYGLSVWRVRGGHNVHVVCDAGTCIVYGLNLTRFLYPPAVIIYLFF